MLYHNLYKVNYKELYIKGLVSATSAILCDAPLKQGISPSSTWNLNPDN